MTLSSTETLIKEMQRNNISIVVVSKTRSVDEILKVYQYGQKVFGENKVQEVLAKYKTLPEDIQWHMIGHLQTNKVKFIAPFISLIHSVDSEKLLSEINKEARKNNRIIDCLLEIKIAQEDSKFGMNIEKAELLLDPLLLNKYSNVKIRGLMGIASDTDKEEILRNEFKNLHTFFIKRKAIQSVDFDILSLGMSGDFRLAIEEGSNMIRIGSAIFGERQKKTLMA